jgi:hypothetical protein
VNNLVRVMPADICGHCLAAGLLPVFLVSAALMGGGATSYGRKLRRTSLYDVHLRESGEIQAGLRSSDHEIRNELEFHGT